MRRERALFSCPSSPVAVARRRCRLSLLFAASFFSFSLWFDRLFFPPLCNNSFKYETKMDERKRKEKKKEKRGREGERERTWEALKKRGKN